MRPRLRSSALPRLRSRKPRDWACRIIAAISKSIVNAGFSLQQRLNDVLGQTGIPDDIDGYRAQLRHDLRTPINAVKGYGEMIVEDATDGGHDFIVSDLENSSTPPAAC